MVLSTVRGKFLQFTNFKCPTVGSSNSSVFFSNLQLFDALCIWGVGRIKKTVFCVVIIQLGKWDDWVGFQPPLDWMENLQETINFPIKYGVFRCANSPKPIHWNHQAVLDFPNLVGILESLGQRPLSELSTGCAGWVAEEPLTRTLAVRRCCVFLCGDFLAKCWSISIQLFFCLKIIDSYLCFPEKWRFYPQETTMWTEHRPFP